MKKDKKNFLKFLAVAIVSMALGWTLSAAGKVSDDKLIKYLTPIYESLNAINNYYYERDKVDYEKLVDHAIEGMLSGLPDKFTHYVSPEMLEDEEIEMSGEYGGLGMEVAWDGEMKAVEIVAPMYGTPAWRAGLKSGDRIVEIDGNPVSDMTFMEAVKRLRGKPGTKVVLKVYREGVKDLLTFEIVREKIQIVAVREGLIDQGNAKIGYVKITKFMDKTYSELRDAVKDLLDKGVEALIIDLRDNPGGYLDQAIETAGLFLDKGIIVSVKDFEGEEEVYKVSGNNIVKLNKYGSRIIFRKDLTVSRDIDVVVLVNRGSASGSEILTGALKDNKRAIVVGQRTFGKGSVQSGLTLSNGGILYLTTAHYITPSGRDIHGKGIDPDVIVKGEEKRETKKKVLDYTKNTIEVSTDDPYIKKAIEVLLKGK